MLKRLLAEFVGAFALVFIGVMATISSQAGGGLVTVALAHGFTIAVMVSAVGHLSGGHFNPAITIGAWVTQRIRLPDALGYILVQLLGGVAGAGLVRVIVPQQIWEGAKLGAPAIPEGAEGPLLSSGEAVLLEAVLTFFLLWVVFATVMDPEGSFGKIAGLAIGFTIAMGIMAAGPFTGAAMNPARAFGPQLVGGFLEGPWWVYWAGPVAGGVIAALLYDTVILRKKPETIEEAAREAEALVDPSAPGAPLPPADEVGPVDEGGRGMGGGMRGGGPERGAP